MSDRAQKLHDRRAAQAADLTQLANEAAEITWARQSRARRGLLAALGLLTLDIGPKAQVSAGMRGASRRQRQRAGLVPFGTVADGGGRYIFAAFAVIVLGAVALLALLSWAVS
jgi:hypothetical protein